MRLGSSRRAIAGLSVDHRTVPSEPIVEPRPHQIVVAVAICREGKAGPRSRVPRILGLEVKVFQLPAPVAREHALDPEADGPAYAGFGNTVRGDRARREAGSLRPDVAVRARPAISESERRYGGFSADALTYNILG